MKRFLGLIAGAAILAHPVVPILVNFCSTLELERGKALFQPWESATGNRQGWALFTRGLMPNAVFASVELERADGEILVVRSEFEPPSKEAFRTPLFGNRAFNSEIVLTLEAEYYTPESVAERPDEWRTILHEAAPRKRAAFTAYLDAVAHLFLPGETPRCSTLNIRRYVDGAYVETLPWFRLTTTAGGRRAEYYNIVDRVWEVLGES